MNEMLKRDLFHQEKPANETKQSLLHFAESQEDFSHVENIWREVYSQELGWLDLSHCDPRHDPYHAFSRYVVARNQDNEAVGVMRVVFNSERGLPIEQFVNIEDLKRRSTGRIIECARLMVPQRLRDLRIAGYPYGIYAAMVKATLHHCMQRGIYDVVVNCFKYTETTPIKSLLQFGFRELGVDFADELNEKSICTVLHLDIRDMLANMYARRKSFNCYMVSHDDLFDIYN